MFFYWWNSPLNPLTSLVNMSDVGHFDDSLLAMYSTVVPFRNTQNDNGTSA
jgi:hypothetical protein